MSKSIFEALFYGKINPFDCRMPLGDERKDIEKKISGAKDYLRTKLSSDDWERFEQLENLYTQASNDDDVKNFAKGFIMGALLMLEITAGKEALSGE